jgi:hypothetical protein
MDNVEIEVVDAPIGELLLEDGLDLFRVVEGVPKLADDEEVFALDETFLDGTGYALASFDFVAIICGVVSKRRRDVEAGSKIKGI